MRSVLELHSETFLNTTADEIELAAKSNVYILAWNMF